MRTRCEKYFRVHRIKHVLVCSIHFVIVLTLCVGVFIWLRWMAATVRWKGVKNFFRQNENPIYFYEHILNPFSLCNHCFYVFSFIFLFCAHSIQSTADHSIPNRFSSLSGRKRVDCLVLCTVLADENTFRFTTFNEKRKKKVLFFFPHNSGERKSIKSNDKRNKNTISRCRHQLTSMWHCDTTPPNIYYVKLSPTTMRPNFERPKKTPSTPSSSTRT